MEDLSNVGLKLFFDEGIYIINEDRLESSPAVVETKKELQKEISSSSILEEPKEEITSINYKGGNKKGIAIIISNESNEYLTDTDETLLLNILKAIGLTFEDIALINQHQAGTKWHNQVNCSKVFLFGIKPVDYNLSSALYELIPVNNAQWLFSNTLAEIGKDKVLKSKLWVKLQEVFPK